MTVSEDQARALRDALAALRDGADGALRLGALPAFAQLGASAMAYDIDLAASGIVGAVVVVARPGEGRPLPGLTLRQSEVARCLAAGLSNKEIAAALGISLATTKDHVHAVLSRLSLRRRAEVAARVRRGEL